MALYFLSFIIGILYYNSTYEGFSSVETKEGYYEFIRGVNFSDNFAGNFINIFVHNLIASLVRILGGILLGVIPIFFIINGAITNSYSLVSFAVDDSLVKSLLLFVPHSLFEIPALMLSSSFGLMLFLTLFGKKKKIENLKNSIKDSLIIFLLWILPLLFVAAIIESILIMIYWF